MQVANVCLYCNFDVKHNNRRIFYYICRPKKTIPQIMPTTQTVTSTATRKVAKVSEPVHHSKGQWITQDELNNHKITAFQKGKQTIFDEYKNIENRNLSAAKVFSETLLFALKDKAKIKCSILYLREVDVFNFDTIAVVPAKTFLSDSFRPAYIISSEVTKQAQENGIRLSFHFISDDKKINTEILVSDGFSKSFRYTN
jgi:hypothetical protein